MAKFNTIEKKDRWGCVNGYEYRGVHITFESNIPRGYVGKYHATTLRGSKIEESTLTDIRRYINDNIESFIVSPTQEEVFAAVNKPVTPVASQAVTPVAPKATSTRFSKATVEAHLTKRLNGHLGQFLTVAGKKFDLGNGWSQVETSSTAAKVLYGNIRTLLDLIVDLQEGI